MPSVSDVRIDELPQMRDARGVLCVAEFSKFVPFAVVRIYFVRDVPAKSARGHHAHHRCSQYMICQAGRLQIDIFDGANERRLDLAPGQAVLIKPGIFATETYVEPGTLMLVLCDRPYEADDYIHSLDDFQRAVQPRDGTD